MAFRAVVNCYSGSYEMPSSFFEEDFATEQLAIDAVTDVLADINEGRGANALVLFPNGSAYGDAMTHYIDPYNIDRVDTYVYELPPE